MVTYFPAKTKLSVESSSANYLERVWLCPNSLFFLYGLPAIVIFRPQNKYPIFIMGNKVLK